MLNKLLALFKKKKDDIKVSIKSKQPPAFFEPITLEDKYRESEDLTEFLNKLNK